MLPKFRLTDSNGRKYCEIILPAGIFYMYEDAPYVWVQQLEPGELSVAEKIMKADEEGEITK